MTAAGRNIDKSINKNTGVNQGENQSEKFIDRSIESIVKEKALEKTLSAIDESVRRFVGMQLPDLSKDISGIVQSPLVMFAVDSSRPYKPAKKQFIREFIRRTLATHWGNITMSAQILGIDRRTLHRLCSQLKIDVQRIRTELPKPEYVRKELISEAVSGAISAYKEILHPKKITELYDVIPSLSDELLHIMGESQITLAEAESEFDKEYFTKLLQANTTVSSAAKAAGLRRETLYRKLKSIGKPV